MDAGAAGEGERPYCVSAGEYKGVEIVFVDVWKTNVYEEFARIRSIMADFPYVAMVTHAPPPPPPLPLLCACPSPGALRTYPSPARCALLYVRWALLCGVTLSSL